MILEKTSNRSGEILKIRHEANASAPFVIVGLLSRRLMSLKHIEDARACLAALSECDKQSIEACIRACKLEMKRFSWLNAISHTDETSFVARFCAAVRIRLQSATTDITTDRT